MPDDGCSWRRRPCGRYVGFETVTVNHVRPSPVNEASELPDVGGKLGSRKTNPSGKTRPRQVIASRPSGTRITQTTDATRHRLNVDGHPEETRGSIKVTLTTGRQLKAPVRARQANRLQKIQQTALGSAKSSSWIKI